MDPRFQPPSVAPLIVDQVRDRRPDDTNTVTPIAMASADAVAYPSTRLRGTIRDLKQGYGFIACTDAGIPDHFFHKSDLRPGALWHHCTRGAVVEFTPDREEKGPAARDIILVGFPY